MSREIKFRGWHSQMKRMFSAEEMAVDQMTLLPTGQFINCHSNVKLSTIYPADKFIPLQFTGLTDKNGKEIYEGDILDGSIKPSIVKFGIIEMNQDDEMDTANGFYKESLYTGNKMSLISGKNENVIGNLHEQPELLKEPTP